MGESKTVTLSGTLTIGHYGESDDILFVNGEAGEICVAEDLEWRIENRIVSCRYWITDKPCTRDEAQEQFVRQLYGATGCQFGACYSEITGYLFTREECQIGGHDLIAELRSHIGKYLILEIEIHK